MNVYLPKTYADWLETNPKEGHIMLIAFLTKLAAIYGTETFFEMYSEDIDAINHTEIKGQTQMAIRNLKADNLIRQANGVALRVTLRLADDKIEGLNRRTILTDSISYQLSFSGALIWTYLMGRMAQVDADIEIAQIQKIREYGNTKATMKFHNKEKKAMTHVLPPVYAEAFIKQVGHAFETPYQKNGIHMTREEYARQYYRQRRDQILAKKKGLYKIKKTESNV